MRTLPLILVTLLAACSSTSSNNGASSSSGGSSSGGSSGASSSGGTTTPLAPPAIGMQLATTKVALPTGAEQYQCWSFKVPEGPGMALVGLENQVPTNGIHHWAVFTNSDPVTQAGPWECATMGISWGLVSGGGLGTPGVKFPAGTSMNLVAGQHIIFQLHMLNASGKDLDVDPAFINLLATNETNLQPVGLLIAGTLDITIPAHSTDTAVSGGCKLQDPLANIFSVFPHMHARGKRISAEIQPAAGGASAMLADQAWGFADQRLYPAQGSAVAGDTVKVTCHYDNADATDVHFGLHTSDEMCINVLYYYPAKKQATYCGIGD